MTAPTPLDRALALVLAHEGGWSDHPADRGGKTLWGVTEGTWRDWLARRRAPARPLSTMTKDEAREIYRALFWQPAGCEHLPWPAAYMVFDAAVHSGPARAVRWLQAALGVAVDGKVGPRTIAAAARISDAQLLAMWKQRADHVAELVRRDPTQAAFLKGWMRRLGDVLFEGARG